MFDILEHIDLLKEAELMAGHKVSLADLNDIGGPDRIRSKSQVRDRFCTSFLGVVHKVTLGEVLSLIADDRNRVFVTTNSSI